MVSDRIFIMNFNMEKVGEILRTENEFVQELNGTVSRYTYLPPILNGLAPAPSQFPEINDVLDYYRMDSFDVWTFLQRSNGIKGSRDYWFMTPPEGEVWIPIFLSEKYQSFKLRMKIGADVRVLMNTQAYVLRRTLDILPPILKDYLIRDGETRFSTVTGEIYDLCDYPVQKGLVGRIILHIPPKS